MMAEGTLPRGRKIAAVVVGVFWGLVILLWVVLANLPPVLKHWRGERRRRPKKLG
jgi:hypothetical protein